MLGFDDWKKHKRGEGLTGLAQQAALANRYQAVMQHVLALSAGELPAASSSPPPTPPVVIAVSKQQPMEAIQCLYHLGQRDFGENYVQELLQKAQQAKTLGLHDLRWHFLGHLQTNKIKSLLPHLVSLHSVSSQSLAHSLAQSLAQALSQRQAELQAMPGRVGGRLPVFLSVNLDQEPSKHGVSEQACEALCQVVASTPTLLLQGLMCIPNPQGSPALAFQRLQALGERVRAFTQGKLSMGMSGDYEAALAAGATHLRLGTAIFGSRAVPHR